MSRLGQSTFVFAALLGGISSAHAAEPMQAWSISVTGGDSPEETYFSFYNEARDYHSALKSFKIAPVNSYEHFGAKTDFRCVTMDGDRFKYRNKEYSFQSLFEQIKSLGPGKCPNEVFDPFLMAITGKATSLMLCSRPPTQAEIKTNRHLSSAMVNPNLNFLDGPMPRPEARGPSPASGTFVPNFSSKQAFQDSITQVERSIKPGDHERHLMLNFIDHGKLTADDSETKFGFGNGETISDHELEQITDRLAGEGITVHLTMDACFGGHFNHLNRSNPPNGKGAVCTAVSSDNTFSASGPGMKTWATALGEYGNQLEALGCLSGDSSFNRYTSGLDKVVRDWEQTLPSLEEIHCLGESSISKLQNLLGEISRTVNTKDGAGTDIRSDLIAAYQHYYMKPLGDCLRTSNRLTDNAFAWLASCAKTKSVSSETLKELSEDGSTATSSYSMETVSRHLRFLKTAPIEALENFKREFCCLGFNFKTLEYPHVCR